MVSVHAGRLDEAERWLELAERGAAGAQRTGAAGPLAALAATCSCSRGDIGGKVPNARRALATAPAADPVWALTPQMVLAAGLWWAGQAGEAKAILEAATPTGQPAAIPATTVYALGIRAAIAPGGQTSGCRSG
jgi:ATP/maltotriose-dependent transcriptional regulator MalT